MNVSASAGEKSVPHRSTRRQNPSPFPMWLPGSRMKEPVLALVQGNPYQLLQLVKSRMAKAIGGLRVFTVAASAGHRLDDEKIAELIQVSFSKAAGLIKALA